MRPIVWGSMVLATVMTACLDDLPVDDVYPCRKPADCIEGFVCHPTRYVCVEESETSTEVDSVDAGVIDSGTTDAGS